MARPRQGRDHSGTDPTPPTPPPAPVSEPPEALVVRGGWQIEGLPASAPAGAPALLIFSLDRLTSV